MSLGQSGKNGPKTQFGLNMGFFDMARKQKVIFLWKKSLLIFWLSKKMPILTWIEFLAHFCHFGLKTFFWLGQKTKSDFFLQNNHFLLTKWSILMAGKLAAVITQIYFGKFCYCVPTWKISKHGFFEPLGGPLWPCNSLLLWTRLFFQIHSETLWIDRRILFWICQN